MIHSRASQFKKLKRDVLRKVSLPPCAHPPHLEATEVVPLPEFFYVSSSKFVNMFFHNV